MKEYDLLVIGAGSGGVRAARMAAAKGLSVAIVEGRFYGGTCVNVGCVPKKLFSYAAHFETEFQDAKGFGWQVGERSFDWSILRANKDHEIARLNQIYENLLKNNGVDIYWGWAAFSGTHALTVTQENGQTQLSAKHILIASGSTPVVPDIPGKENFLISDDLFYLESLPNKALVIGGGYIAVEFACILHGLGVDTTLAYRKDLFLRGFDLDIRHHLKSEMQSQGIKLLFEHNPELLEKKQDEILVSWQNKEESNFSHVFAATGRKPLTDQLNLTEAGVDVDAQGAVVVNNYYQTKQAHIYAVGDVINKMTLTPVALAEAMVVVDQITTQEQKKLDYDCIPTAVFSHPNLATVGLSEQACLQQGYQIDVYLASFRPLKNTLSNNPEKAMLKLIVDTNTDKILGAHMAGPDAGEAIQGIAIAMKAGATKAHFDATIGIHPTLAEEWVTMRSVTRQVTPNSQ